MTQEEILILHQDLAGRVQYGVKCWGKAVSKYDVPEHTWQLTEVYKSFGVGFDFYYSFYSLHQYEVKPYLFPLSSLTNIQRKEVADIMGCDIPWSLSEENSFLEWPVGGGVESELLRLDISRMAALITWFCKNHIDYNGLIPRGLAIDATNSDMYK